MTGLVGAVARRNVRFGRGVLRAVQAAFGPQEPGCTAPSTASMEM